MTQYNYNFTARTGCSGGNICCTNDNQCGEEEGHCNSDADCVDDLVCGTDNCVNNNDLWWDLKDNCCEKPECESHQAFQSGQIYFNV